MAIKEAYLPRHVAPPGRLAAEDLPAEPAAGLTSSLAVLVVFDLSLLGHELLLCRLVSLLAMLLLPGMLLAGRLRLRCNALVLRLGMVLGLSCLTLMAQALLGSWLLPIFGVSDPLGLVPTAVGFNVIALALVVACRKLPDPVAVTWGTTRHMSPEVLLLVLPVASVAGVERLNSGHGSLVVQVVIWVAVALFCLGLQRASANEGTTALVLLVASLSLLYLYSYRGGGLFGYDIQQEFQRFRTTYQLQRWTPPTNGDPYAAMLSITALPAALSRTTGISGEFLFRGLYPVFTAYIPAFTYSFARRWLPGRAAYIGASFMVVLADFAAQLPALARQEAGLFFFTLLLWTMFGYAFGRRARRVATVALMGALVVSHYSSSYVVVTLLAATWAAYALARLLQAWVRRGQPKVRPVVTLWLVATMLAMIVAWDAGITHSSGNVTKFVSSLADNGLEVLPNAKSGSLLDRYLKGNVAPGMTPSQYYSETEAAARAQEPWLNPFPKSVVDRYPAAAAPTEPNVKALIPGVAAPLSSALTVADELFLFGMGAGALLVVALALGRGRPRVPLEAGLLAVATVGFLAVVRLSGTVDTAYNSDRAELQAAIVLSIGLGAVVAPLIKRARWLAWVPMAALAVMLVTTIGESNQIVGGPTEVTTSNSGFNYQMFVVQPQEIAAARWMVSTAGDKAVYYSDDVGMLRIWDATNYAELPHTWLTPGALDQGAWVYATQYNVEGGIAFGAIDGRSVAYRFPAAFLSNNYNRVYTSPGAAVYH